MNLTKFLVMFAGVFVLSWLLNGCTQIDAKTTTGHNCIYVGEAGDDIEGSPLGCVEDNDTTTNPAPEPESPSGECSVESAAAGIC